MRCKERRIRMNKKKNKKAGREGKEDGADKSAPLR